MVTNVNKERETNRGLNNRKKQGKKNRNVTHRLGVFQTDGNLVNHRHILDHCVLSGQETRMKYIYLDSSKSGEYADINFIPSRIVFQKTKNFPAFFFRVKFCRFCNENWLKIVYIMLRIKDN